LRVNHSNPGHVRAAMVGVLCLGGLSGLMATGLLGPFRSGFAEHYDISQGRLGPGIAVIGIVLGIVGIWQGPKLADRIGRYRLLKCSVGMMTIGLAGCGLWRNLSVLAGFWALFMLGAYLSIIANAVATDLWRDKPRRGVLLLHSTLSVGKIIGPSIATLCMIALAGLPWRGFFFFGAACSLTILLFLSFVRQGKVYHPKEEHSWEEDPLDRPLALWLSAALLGLIAGSETALASIAPLFFKEQHLLSGEFAAELLTFHFIALTAGRFTFGIFGGKLSSTTIVALAVIPAALIVPAAYPSVISVLVPATCFSARATSIVCFVLVGLCFAATWPAIFAHVAGVFARNRSRLTLAVGLMNASGIAAGTAATSWIFESNRPVAMLFGPVLLVLCAGAFILGQSSLGRAALPPADSSPC